MITKDEIKKYITTTLLEGRSDAIAQDQDLLMTGILDSMNVMKLAAYLEEKCDFAIPAHDIVLENFSTIEQMHAYLTGRAG